MHQTAHGLISPPGLLHPELLLVKMDGCGRCSRDACAGGTGVGRGADGAANTGEPRWQGVGCYAVPKGNGHGEKGGCLNSTCPIPLILLCKSTKYIYIYSMRRVCYQLAKGNYYFKDCSSHGRFVLLLNYNLQLKGKKNEIYTFI